MEEHYKNISNSKPIILDGKNLTISDLYSIAYNNQPVSLADDSKSKIIFCRKMVEDKIKEGEIVYGINTGRRIFRNSIR